MKFVVHVGILANIESHVARPLGTLSRILSKLSQTPRRCDSAKSAPTIRQSTKAISSRPNMATSPIRLYQDSADCGSSSRFFTSRHECSVQGVTGGKYGHERMCFPFFASTLIWYPLIVSQSPNSLRTCSSSSADWTLASASKNSEHLSRSAFLTIPPSSNSESGCGEQPTLKTTQSTIARRLTHRSPGRVNAWLMASLTQLIKSAIS